MTTDICPTITAYDSSMYLSQISRLTPFAKRIHIDLCDGVFAPTNTIDPDKIWWPGGLRADIHVMYKDPSTVFDIIRALGPQLVIVHAEADGDFGQMAENLHKHGVEVGVALLPNTSLNELIPALSIIDHILIFSGNLGHQGGSTADLKLLDKAREARSRKPSLEIGWDGGVNENNIQHIVDAGVDVINVGGFIQQSHDPKHAYDVLTALTERKGLPNGSV